MEGRAYLLVHRRVSRLEWCPNVRVSVLNLYTVISNLRLAVPKLPHSHACANPLTFCSAAVAVAAGFGNASDAPFNRQILLRGGYSTMWLFPRAGAHFCIDDSRPLPLL